MRAEAKTNGNSTSGETGASARPARKVVRCQGVRGALVKGADGWKLDHEHEVQALAAKDGTGCVLDRFKALAAALNAGVVAVSDVGRLNNRLDAIADKPDDLARYVRVPNELLPAVVYACACLSNWNGSEWLAWVLASRLDDNVFKGWPVESAPIPGDASPSIIAAGFLAFTVDDDSDENFLDAIPASFWERLRTHVEARLRAVTAASDPLAEPRVLKKLARSDEVTVLYCVAIHPDTPAKTLRRLAKKRRLPEEARWGMARNMRASPELLEILARDRSEKVRSVAAAHPATPVSVLTALSSDQSYYVRAAVALHPNTPQRVLLETIQDEVLFVVRNAAGNPAVPLLALRLMLYSNSRWLRADAVRHPNTPVQLTIPFATDRSLEVRRMVAYKPGMPASILEHLARDPKAKVRAAVAWNANTPTETLEALAADGDALVSSAVEARLNAPDEVPPAPPGSEDIDDADTGRRLLFLAQPPGKGVDRSEWAQAFAESMSPNPDVRQRGRDTLTYMGSQWIDPVEPQDPPTN